MQSGSLIEDNFISENVAGYGGGIYCHSGANSIINNEISFNEARGGGGISCRYGWYEVIGNSITNNSASQGGGGIRASHAFISENYIYGNYGGNIYGGGGIYSTASSGGGMMVCEGFIGYNIVYDNTAFNGGGIAAGGDGIISNNTVINNAADYEGGGINCLFIVDPTIINSIFWDNSPNDVFEDAGSNAVFSHCNIMGGWPGDGNIDCDPKFCDPATNDYHISDISCCVGAGLGGVDIGALGIGCYASAYLMGDVNMYNGAWPPLVVGGDVTYLVNYFRNLPTSSPCLLAGFWASADANGDCQIIGSDVTRIVNYFKGSGDLSYCPDNPPIWLDPDDMPVEAPEGWPNCE
jgi:hypothetical protein